MAPANLTKLVADKLKKGEDRKHDLAVHGASLPARVAQALGQPGLERPLAALFAEAEQARAQNDGRLVEVDRAYLVELSDDVTVRADKADAESTLYTTLTGVRAVISTVHGPAQVRAVGFLGDTPTDLAQLTRLASVVAMGLHALPPPPPTSRLTVDVGGLCADIDAATASATAALSASKADLRENEAAIRARNDALVASHRSQVFLGELMRLCAMTVGDQDLQHRLRDLPLSTAGTEQATPEATPAAG